MVSSPLVSLGLGSDGAMQTPKDPEKAGWYEPGPTLAGHDEQDTADGRPRYLPRMTPEELPYVDTHTVRIAAPPEAVWPALVRTVVASFSGARVESAARLLGCTPARASDWSRPGPEGTLAGFRAQTVEPPVLLVLAGRHRFSRYALTFRLEEAEGGVWCRAETRAAFPGLHGRLYRAAVIGTGGHRVLLRRMLRHVRQRAGAAG
jgi:uncharacterized protein YndB with AHSA1/START domain